jgi:acetate kinase
MSQIGVQLDRTANEAATGKEAQISATGSHVKVFVVPTNEQVGIAKDTYELAAQGHPVASR